MLTFVVKYVNALLCVCYRFKPRFSVLSHARFVCILTFTAYNKVRDLCRLGRQIFCLLLFCIFPINVYF